MSEDKIAALIIKAQYALDTEGTEWEDLYEPLGLVSALVNALDSVVRDMHLRELHHFETEQRLYELDNELQILKETTP
jgi:hypothetical protein